MGDLARTPYRQTSETEPTARRAEGALDVHALSQGEIDALWNRLRDRRRVPAAREAEPAPKIA